MSIRILGKKALAIILTMTVLASCMVFSYSASAEATLLWENDFDEQLATNWYSLYGGEDGLGNYNTGRVNNADGSIYNYFVPKMDANGNGYMAYGVKDATGHQRPAGFIITHQSATVKNAAADTYGNAGYHKTTASVNKGAFKPKAGKYAVKLDYKVPDTANLTSDVELYIAFSDKLWKNVCNWGSGGSSVSKMEADGKLIKEQIATVTQADVGGDWQTAVAYVDASAIPANLTSDTGWWASIIARPSNTGAASMSGSEVWVDNITISLYNDMSDFPTVSFYHNGGKVGETAGVAGSAFTLPDLSSIAIPAGGSLAYFEDEECTVPTTLPTVFPSASQTVYVKVIESTERLPKLLWENDFDTQTSSNWHSLYGTKEAGTTYSTGRVDATDGFYNYFVPQKDGDNGYMAYGVTNETGHQRPAGFVITHKSATTKGAEIDTYGNAGYYATTSNLKKGVFKPKAGKYAVKLEYKVPAGANLTTDVELHVLIMQSTYMWKNTNTWTNITNNVSSGKGVIAKLATVTQQDAGGEWQTAVAYLDASAIPTDLKSDTAWWPSIVARPVDTSAASMSGSEIWVDNISISLYTSTVSFYFGGSEVGKKSGAVGAPFTMPDLSSITVPDGYMLAYFDDEACTQPTTPPSVFADESRKIYIQVLPPSSVTFHYDGGIVGQLHNMPGVPFEMPTLSIHTPIGAYLSYYEDEACTRPIELPTVYPDAAQDIYIKLTKTENFTWSFEDEAVGTALSLNNSAKSAITVDDAMANEGVHGARVNGYTKLVQFYPQMTLRDGNSQKIQVYKHRSYEVSFKVFKPTTEPTYKMNYWLAVTEDELPVSRMADGTVTNEVARYLTVGVIAGQWVDMTATISDCAFTGLLRLGIAGNYEGDHTFYIDDITVTEISPDPDNTVDSFERYDESKTVLSLNTDGSSITVSDIDRRSGANCAKIATLGSDINAAPQMTVNDFRTNSITVEKGKNYRVSFYVLNPIQQPDYDIRFWLAATDSDAAFTTTRENVILDTQTIAIEEKQVWQRVSVNILNCAYSGKLRLGITGSTDEAHIFYIDDIGVTEYKEANPDAMNFEMYEVGETIDLNRDKTNTITITDKMSYTGDKSAYFSSDNNTYDSRPHMFVRDAEGNIVKVKKGDDFVVSFMIYISSSQPYFSFSYWLAATPEADGDKPFEYSADRSKYTSRNFLLPGEVFGGEMPPAGEWTMVKIAVMDCPYEGNLRIGMTHGNRDPYYSNFYIDDITINPPEYVLVKFNTNGAENTYEDVTVLADMLLPTADYIPPYRAGYQFMGWYTSPNFVKDTYFDIYSTPVTATENGVLTLYAMWREWSEDKSTVGGREETEKYKTEYYTDKVWVGDQNVPDPWDTGDVPSYTEEESVTVPPANDDVPPDDGIPPWLIVVIIIAAVVVVGGGAAVAAILLKKKKA